MRGPSPDPVLGLHIASGAFALLVAPAAMLAPKGGTWHRRFGRLFFWSMAVVAMTAACIAYVNASAFLLLVTVFSFYLAFSGVRAARRSRHGAGAPDWCAALLALGSGVGLVVLPLRSPWRPFGIVMVTFGVLEAMVAGRDVFDFVRRPPKSDYWRSAHMGKMLGSYVGALIAVSAIQLTMLPELLRWLWPVALGVPVIWMWTAHDRRDREARVGVAERTTPGLTRGTAA